MSSSQSDRARQRRRIIQAAVGAPVVFTLPSGAALAAASLTCDDKSNLIRNTGIGGTDTALGVEAAPDGWVRYRLQVYEINPSGSGGKTNGITFDANPSSSSIWYTVNLSTGAATQVTVNGSPSLISGLYYYALVDYSAYPSSTASAYVYPAHAPVGSPIAGGSCWTSLLPTSSIGGNNVIN